MVDLLEGLRPEERFACVVAERVTGGVAEAWDVNGRQGAVDAMLRMPDGRTAGFEVTAYDEDYGIQIDSLLTADRLQWPPAGEWLWTIRIGSRSDLPRLRKCYGHIVQLCEAADVGRPEDLWARHLDVDADVAWLVEESSSSMWGQRRSAAVDDRSIRDVMVLPAIRGGGVDTSLEGLHAALGEMFEQPGVAKHLRKAAAAEADEKHLCLLIHRSALPFAVADGLWSGDTLPPDPPPLPTDVTHLWLMPAIGRRVLLWTLGGWQQHWPYDQPKEPGQSQS